MSSTASSLRRIFIPWHPGPWLLLLFLLFFAASAFADTLYQRSYASFAARARQASPDDYTFVVLGDSRSNDAVFRKLLLQAAGYDPLFILHCGDYSTEGGEEETNHFLSLLSETVPSVPVFVVLGNHERRQVFDRQIGPPRFVLQSPRLGLKLIALDNAREELYPAELSYLKDGLASSAMATFVAMHVPPETKRWRGHTFTRGASELERVITGNPDIKGLFFAHSHLYDRSEFGGVPAFISGGAGAPLVWFSRYGERVYHFIVVRVQKGRVSYQMVRLK